MDKSWSTQLQLFGLLVVAVIWVQLSAWDEKDYEQLRAEAEHAKADGVRYLVERSGYAPVAWTSDFHCRTPRKGERLVMQLANPRDPGKGFRCTYWLPPTVDLPSRAEVTWSRSPGVVMRLSSDGRP